MTSPIRTWAVIGAASLGTWGMLLAGTFNPSGAAPADAVRTASAGPRSAAPVREPGTGIESLAVMPATLRTNVELRDAVPTQRVQGPPPESAPPVDVPTESCPTNLRLEATVYQARSPQRSLALLRTAEAPSASLFRPGARLGGYVLHAIGPRAVVLRREHSECLLRMSRAPRGAASARSSARRSVRPTPVDPRIRKLGVDRYLVERGVLTSAFGGVSSTRGWLGLQLLRGATGIMGMRVHQLDRAGLGAQLGLQRGDVLREVNGYSLTTTEGLLRARRELASARRLTLSLLRSGSRRSVSYDVR